jgi:hypothetical protein
MKQIKFRAWHEVNKKFDYATIKDIWINGWLCCEGLESPKLPKDKGGHYTNRKALEKYNAFVPNAEWEQFTGLCDKNGKGKEAYHHDIIKRTVQSPWDSDVPMDITGEITWNYGGWWFDCIETTSESCYLVECENFEVIGNIYEENDDVVRQS